MVLQTAIMMGTKVFRRRYVNSVVRIRLSIEINENGFKKATYGVAKV